MDMLSSVLGMLSGNASNPKPTQPNSKGSKSSAQDGGIFGKIFKKRSAQNINVRMKNPLYDMFNERIGELMEHLAVVLPENTTLPTAVKIHKKLSAMLPGEPVKRWIEAIEGYQHLLKERSPVNEEAFIKASTTMPYICELQVATYWPEFDDAGKDNLWLHLAQIDELATNASIFDPGLMGEINNMAQMFANNNTETLDLNTIQSSLLDQVLGNHKLLEMVGIPTEVANDPSVRAKAQEMSQMFQNVASKDLSPEEQLSTLLASVQTE